MSESDGLNGCSRLFRSKLDSILKLTNARKATIFMHADVKPQLQVGPTCGFAALAMALQTLEAFNLTELVELAKADGITNGGELFSAQWLAEFVGDHWPQFCATTTEFPGPEAIVKHFSDDKWCAEMRPTIMVPYDCDKNFEPCQRDGQAAHWAILTGFLLLVNSATDEMSNDTGILNCVVADHFNKRKRNIIIKPENNIDESLFYVIAYQGKSRHPALWPYSSLRQSNAQLNRPNPAGSANFRLPSEGMALAIRGKCVLLGKAAAANPVLELE